MRWEPALKEIRTENQLELAGGRVFSLNKSSLKSLSFTREKTMWGGGHLRPLPSSNKMVKNAKNEFHIKDHLSSEILLLKAYIQQKTSIFSPIAECYSFIF